jgi:transketolase
MIFPADANQTDRIIRWLINKPGNYLVTMGRSKIPVLKKLDGSPQYDLDYNYIYGKADVLRDGNDGSMWVCGTPVAKAIKAIDILREEGIFLELLYVSSPLHLDIAQLKAAANKGIIFSVEDHSVNGGLGTSIADGLVANSLSAKLIKMGIKQYPMSGESNELYHWAGLDTASLIATVKKNLQ